MVPTRRKLFPPRLPTTHATQLLIRTPTAIHVRKHWHSANEMHMLITGTAKFACEGKSAELGPGSFNFMPAKMVHEAWLPAGLSYFYYGRWRVGCELGGRSPNGSRPNQVSASVNWEAINAIAQLVSSIGVIVSLLYLAVQVHRSTRITKLAAQDAATTALRDVTRPFAENPEVGLLWRKGLEDINSLGPDEKARFFHVAFQFLKAMGDNSFPLHLRRDGGTSLARLAQSLSALSRCAGTELLLAIASQSFLRSFSGVCCGFGKTAKATTHRRQSPGRGRRERANVAEIRTPNESPPRVSERRQR